MDVADGFQRTEVGLIPSDWSCIESFVNSFVTLAATLSVVNPNLENGIRWLKIANVGIQKAKWEDTSYLPAKFSRQFPSFVLSEGDVVMALTRPILNGKLKDLLN